MRRNKLLLTDSESFTHVKLLPPIKLLYTTFATVAAPACAMWINQRESRIATAAVPAACAMWINVNYVLLQQQGQQLVKCESTNVNHVLLQQQRQQLLQCESTNVNHVLLQQQRQQLVQCESMRITYCYSSSASSLWNVNQHESRIATAAVPAACAMWINVNQRYHNVSHRTMKHDKWMKP